MIFTFALEFITEQLALHMERKKRILQVLIIC